MDILFVCLFVFFWFLFCLFICFRLVSFLFVCFFFFGFGCFCFYFVCLVFFCCCFLLFQGLGLFFNFRIRHWPHVYPGDKLCDGFCCFYFREVSELIISIIQARDLTPNQYSGTLDTYIRGIILPNLDTKFQSKVSLAFFKNVVIIILLPWLLSLLSLYYLNYYHCVVLIIVIILSWLLSLCCHDYYQYIDLLLSLCCPGYYHYIALIIIIVLAWLLSLYYPDHY